MTTKCNKAEVYVTISELLSRKSHVV